VSPPLKVQCQLSRRYLLPGCRKVGGVWECPHCGRDETYTQAELVDAELCELVHGAVDRARQLFRVEADEKETRIWLGDGPEAVFEKDLDAFHIYLGRDSDWLVYCYSGSHEAFHRACSPCREKGHWVDEVLAVHFSLRYLREIGFEDHAVINEVSLRRQSYICPRSEVMSPDGPGSRDDRYGAFFSIGQSLIEVVGWEGLVALNRFRDPDGRPEPDRWVASLSDETRLEIGQALTD
jgi:hypothetical protein